MADPVMRGGVLQNDLNITEKFKSSQGSSGREWREAGAPRASERGCLGGAPTGAFLICVARNRQQETPSLGLDSGG
jgi:hypothetical protein